MRIISSSLFTVRGRLADGCGLLAKQSLSPGYCSKSQHVYFEVGSTGA